MIYPRQNNMNSISANPKFPNIEEDILEFWSRDDTFNASMKKNANKKEFIFYDGPPFANGKPHYGHLLTGYVKDFIARYKTQKGFFVLRRFGWDTHGLPAELEVQKQLNINSKNDIEKIGIESFNEACKKSVMQYSKDWEKYINRQARWVDFKNDYKTLNLEFMESTIWAFKSLYEKNLIYEGFRVLPYCWNDETPLSSHELSMDSDTYKAIQAQAITIGFRLFTKEIILVWTTTPWTLPSNLALAVNKDVNYVVVKPDKNSQLTGEKVILAENLFDNYKKELGEDALILDIITGQDLINKKYYPIFPYFNKSVSNSNAFKILSGDFVSTDDGTGVVHIAPGFGEDDKKICDSEGIPTIVPVNSSGKFDSRIPEYQNINIFEANKIIIDDLSKKLKPINSNNVFLVRVDNYTHSYPHCWRCRKPLIYKAVKSWFVKVTKIKKRMIDINKSINWVPENVKEGQFGKWLENARDWSISRNRYWGTPIPVWVSDDKKYPRIDVYGSLEEIKRDFNTLPKNKNGEIDLHRPFIDNLVRLNPDDPTGKSKMRRVDDILDVWFDSGSMPYAQIGYPKRNKSKFESNGPGDFIVEYIGQTRGWFYTLHVLSVALFDRQAFNSAISHGIVLGSDGQKMSKSLCNYPDISVVFNKYGSDALRWFLLSSPIMRGGNLIVKEKSIIESVRRAILPMWNAWYFFSLYSNIAFNKKGYKSKEIKSSKNLLDSYIISKTSSLIEEVDYQLDKFNISYSCELISQYFDILNNWYIRRSRQRFWNDDKEAFNTLFTCLKNICEVMAPFSPLITEEIWRGLTGKRSVHLVNWPDNNFEKNITLVEHMDLVRSICSVASSLRKKKKLRVRLPLNKLTIVCKKNLQDDYFANIIMDEINVKHVEFINPDSIKVKEEYKIRNKLLINPRLLGPRIGKNIQTVLNASKKGQWHFDENGVVVCGNFKLERGEFSLETVFDETADKTIGMLPNDLGFISLDIKLNPLLEAEGASRDLIRSVQEMRKNKDLDIADRIELTITSSNKFIKLYEQFKDLISKETLSTTLKFKVGHESIQIKKALYVE